MKDRGMTLDQHMKAVKEGRRCFENAFQSVSRMILDKKEMIEKVIVNGKSTYDFRVFRVGRKHVIGMFDEINSFVPCIKDAAEGGSSREMAFVLVGEPGNGKTFFVETLCSLYRQFLAEDSNKRYTFNSSEPSQASIRQKTRLPHRRWISSARNRSSASST